MLLGSGEKIVGSSKNHGNISLKLCLSIFPCTTVSELELDVE